MILPILTIPDPFLKTRSASVKNITPEVEQLIADMQETMRHYPHCIGIAAPQVGKALRIIAIDVSLNPKPHPNHGELILLNPIITFSSGLRKGREGCLSVPEFTGNVTRAEQITVEAIQPAGRPLRLETEGFEATVIQHELDHLNGILFLDRVASLKTDIFRRKK